jgi:hypothetical protein
VRRAIAPRLPELQQYLPSARQAEPLLRHRRGEKNPNPKPLSGMAIQVWLLKSDGTSLPQREKPANLGIGNAGSDTDIMLFSLDDAPPKDVAGVVVRANGKLYIHEIVPDR